MLIVLHNIYVITCGIYVSRFTANMYYSLQDSSSVLVSIAIMLESLKRRRSVIGDTSPSFEGEQRQIDEQQECWMPPYSSSKSVLDESKYALAFRLLRFPSFLFAFPFLPSKIVFESTGFYDRHFYVANYNHVLKCIPF